MEQPSGDHLAPRFFASDESAPVIPIEHVKWHPSWTGADPYGRLLEWEGQFLRAIKATYHPVYTKIFGTELARRVVGRGLLIDSVPTRYKLDGYAWVIKHRRLPFVSFPHEWSSEMLREAGLTVVNLNLELIEEDLYIHDPHGWNVLFDAYKAVFIDLSSIRSFENQEIWPSLWPTFEEFCEHFLYPLYLIADGYERLVRSLLRDLNPGVRRDEFIALHGSAKQSRRGAVASQVQGLLASGYRRMPEPLRPWLRKGFRTVRGAVAEQVATKQHRRRFLQCLRDEIERIDVSRVRASGTETPRNDAAAFASPAATATRMKQCVSLVIERCRPERVLDASAGEGWFAEVAAEHGCTVAAFDPDSRRIDALFRRAQTRDLAILPVVMDLKNPSPAAGVCYKKFAAATERFRADLVLALDLVHHLALRRTLDFDHIVEALSQFTRRWLLVGFVSGDDPAGHPEWREWYPWYTWDNFLKALNGRFDVLQVMETGIPSRRIVLCEKRAA